MQAFYYGAPAAAAAGDGTTYVAEFSATPTADASGGYGSVGGAAVDPTLDAATAAAAAGGGAAGEEAGGTMVSTVFGMLVSGRPVQTDFLEVVPGARYVAQLEAPAAISEVSLFLLPGNDFPADKGIAVYYGVPPYSEWTLLGTLHAGRKSATFRTGWPTMPEVASQAVVQIGLSVEPIETITNLTESLTAAEWDKLGFVELVANDFARYASSFAQVTPMGERLVLPVDCVDR